MIDFSVLLGVIDLQMRWSWEIVIDLHLMQT